MNGRRHNDDMVQGVFDIDSADMVREVGWSGGEGVDGEGLDYAC